MAIMPEKTLSDTQEMEILLSWSVTGRLEPEQSDQLDRYLAGHPKAAAWIEAVENDSRAARVATLCKNE